MMTKSFWITLASVAVPCVLVLFLQSHRNRDLALRVDDGRAELAALERDLRNFETVALDSPLRRGMTPVPGSREEAMAESRAATTPAERVRRARGRLDQLMAGLGDSMGSPTAFFRVLPDMLRVIQELSLDELIAVADGMEASPSSAQGNPTGITRMILYLLAAEQDPQRVMRNDEIMKDREVRDAVLGVLGKRDPEAALRWVKQSDLNELDKQRILGVAALRLMREDIDKGLDMLREGGVGTQMNFLGVGALPMTAEKLPELVAAMRKPENADFRRQLLTMTMATAMLDGGVEAARRHVEELGITGKEVSEYLSMGNISFADGSEAHQALDWMREVQTPEEWGQAFPNAIAQWAQRDYNAAGEWLGKQEASAEKDIAVQRFVQTVVPVDPQSAVVWANSIDGEGARAVSLVFASEQWLVKDKAAAEAWIAENGIDLPALRERAGGAANPAVGPQATLPTPTRADGE